MTTCHSCGAEMSGAYCNTCGARAMEERGVKKPKKEPVAKASGPVAKAGREPGLFSPQRIWRTVATGAIALLVYGGGVYTGIYLAQGSSANTGTQAASGSMKEVLESMPPMARANFYMESGVALMNEGQRSAAVAEFRKSLAEWEQLLKDEPDNLYAMTYMGLTYYYVGDSNKAVETLRQVLVKDENYLWAIFNMAWIYETAGKKTESILMYQKYITAAEIEGSNVLKYAEQAELIPRQVEAAKAAIARLGGGTGK